jgi:hypothetical protein
MGMHNPILILILDLGVIIRFHRRIDLSHQALQRFMIIPR